MSRPVRRSVSGHYAGAVSRASAAVVDWLIIGALYTLGVAGFGIEGCGSGIAVFESITADIPE